MWELRALWNNDLKFSSQRLGSEIAWCCMRFAEAITSTPQPQELVGSIFGRVLAATCEVSRLHAPSLAYPVMAQSAYEGAANKVPNLPLTEN